MGASRSVELKNSPVRAWGAGAPADPDSRDSGARLSSSLVQAPGDGQREARSAFHFALLGGGALPLLLALLGVLLLGVRLLLGRLPVVVLVLPLVLVVVDREVAARLDPFLLGELGLFQLHLGQRRVLVRVGGAAGQFEPVLFLVQPVELGLRHLDADVGDLLVVARGIGAVLVVRSVGRFLLGGGLLDLQVGLFLLRLGHVQIALQLFELVLGGPLLAVGELDLFLRG